MHIKKDEKGKGLACLARAQSQIQVAALLPQLPLASPLALLSSKLPLLSSPVACVAGCQRWRQCCCCVRCFGGCIMQRHAAYVCVPSTAPMQSVVD
eukprot:SAG25_NODE_642_length_6224_cov_2.486041_10_plen_96_part_00